MSIKKILTLTVITTTLAITAFIYHNKTAPTMKDETTSSDDSLWTTFEKSQTQNRPPTITSHPTTAEEFKKLKIDKNKDTDNSTNHLKQIRLPKIYKGRELLGFKGKKIDLDQFDQGFTNQPSKDWKKILAKNLMNFQTKDTLLFIKEDKKLIGLKRSRPIFLEQVTVTYLLPNGNRNSFRALVDSEHGVITEVWDKTQRDEFLERSGQVSSDIL